MRLDEPMKLSSRVLNGERVRLEPLAPSHLEAISAVALEGDLFRWFPEPMRTREALAAYVERFARMREEGTGMGFAIVLKATGQVVGGTSCYALEPRHRRVEIGYSWIATPWQRSGVNREAKRLLLAHAFETMGCLRVEFKTDRLNAQSQRALERLGAVREGVFRAHMICEGGRVRDSVYFSIVRDEWPALKARLDARITSPCDPASREAEACAGSKDRAGTP